MSDNISRSLQENLITLLCFDEKAAPIIVNNVEPDLFESSIYREIVTNAKNYYIQYKEPVGDHLIDLFDHVIHGTDEKKAQLYKDVFLGIHDLKEYINRDYVLSELSKFVRQQKLKQSIRKAAEQVQAGDLDKAELTLEEGKKGTLQVFDPGICFFDKTKGGILNFLKTIDEYHKIGVSALDNLGICPAPKELFLISAAPGKGKSWFFNHIGKFSVLQRKKVLHITLEMSADKVSMRYIQSLFGVAKHEGFTPRNTIFEKTVDGHLASLSFEQIPLSKVLTLRDPDIGKVLQAKIDRMLNPLNLVVKEFPTGQLTMSMLKAYLNNLEAFYNFIPDILMIDYPDLMYMNSANVRLETGAIFKDLRGIAVEKNISVIVPSQVNRAGESTLNPVELLTREHLSEDFSKIMTADNHITFNQSREEKALGLARLYVDKGRNDRSGDIVLISQNYSIGQFCLDSVLLIQHSEYKTMKTAALSGESKVGIF